MINRKIILTIFVILICNLATAQRQLLKIGLFADCQAAQTENRKGRHYTKAIPKLVEAIEEFNEKNVEMVVSMGDLIDRDIYTLKQIDTVVKTLKMPFYNLLGNHELQLLDLSQEINRTMNLTEPYYRSIRQNGVRLILLNTNDQTLAATKPNTPERAEAERTLAKYKENDFPNADKMNGLIAEQQMKWLEGELKEATATKEVVVVMSHHPLIYLFNVGAVLNKEQIIKLLESYPCVKAHISGHCHIGGYFERNGIHYVVLKGMVETLNNRYAVVGIYDNKIVIDGRGDEQSRELKYNKNH